MTHANSEAHATAYICDMAVNCENASPNMAIATVSSALTAPVPSPTTVALSRNNSDSHITRLNAQKNQSNLYFIKSYSFIDKSLKNHVRPRKSKSTSPNSTSLRQIDKQPLENSKSATQQETKANVKQKKSKSASPHHLDEDLRALLRHPDTLQENEELEKNDDKRERSLCRDTHLRPKSMPAPSAANIRTHTDTSAPPPPQNKSKKSTADLFKRDSFLRHSLQSIRRSFTAKKKFAGFGQNATMSNASTNSTKSACSKTSKISPASASASSSSSSSSSSSKSAASSSTTSTASASTLAAADAADILRYANKMCRKSEKLGITVILNDKAVPRLERAVEDCGCDNRSFVANATQKSEVNLCESVSTFATTPNDSTSMAPLQSHAETQSVTTLNLHGKARTASPPTSIGSNSSTSNSTQQKQKQQQRHQRNNSNQSDYYTAAYAAATSDSSTQNTSINGRGEGRSLNPLAPSESTTSIRSISPTSRKSATSSNWSSHTTAKHEQSTAAATAAAAVATTTIPTEKEKKRKEVSSSRVKKFHRHFTQVSKDEKLINYFSCALVSDILLQGHLYITDQHFAFYSNVFGYVTKVVIPTSSVTKISKEKTAKIIPNAVGVATADERHVFGSFISREAAFRLMCSVCPPLAPVEILPKTSAEIEISEEYSIEDDSSCSISGNESPPQALAAAAAAAAAGGIEELSSTLIRRNVASSSLNIADGNAATCEHQRHSAPPIDAKQVGACPNTGVASHATLNADGINVSCSRDVIASTGIALIVAGTASSTSASSSPTPSTSSSLPTTVMAVTSSSTPKSAAYAAVSSFRRLTQKALLRLKFPTELHVVYLGVLLTMVLALFSVFLLYRILDIEAKTSAYRTPSEFNWHRAGNDDDIFAEALRWQKELQAKSTEEAQNILTQNLEQIAKVRRSLETLSMLIHDRNSAYANRDDSD